MQSLKNKIVFITGASSGIGKSCAEQFAAFGARLIISARRTDRIKKLAAELIQKNQVDVLPIELDVRNKKMVQDTIDQLPDHWKNIDILINNAGLALSTDKIQEGNPENWDTMIDTNVKGLLYVTRAILPGMIARDQGHIINIGSIAGEECYPGGNVYSATKYAVKAITKSLKIDLLGTPIRTSEISPGAVETEFSEVRWHDKERAKDFYTQVKALMPDDVADAAIYCATRRPEVNIHEIRLLPICQASVNHIDKTSKT